MSLKETLKQYKLITSAYKKYRAIEATAKVDARHLAIETNLIKGDANYTRFVIISRGRSGTSFLRSMLNAHEQIIAFGELFREYGAIGWDLPGYRQTGRRHSLIQHAPVEFIEKYVFQAYPSHVAAVGFKLFYYHARNPEWETVWRYVKNAPDIQIIHLKRRNILATHLSLRRAFLTDKWTNTTNAPEQIAPLTLTYEECLEAFETTKQWEAQADALFTDSRRIEVIYEELAADTVGEMERIQAFLDVDYKPVKPRLFKQNKRPLSETITNYAELEVKFRGTPWHVFFAD